MNKLVCCCGTLAFTGIAVLIAGIVLIPTSKSLIDNEIKAQITLKAEDTYDNWVKNPTPIYFQLWVWDLTNPDEVQKGEKPALVQKGPYTYSESRQKINVNFNDSSNTVSYREDKYYTFVPSMSVGSENDTFVTVNIPLMLISNIVKREFTIIQEIAAVLLDWGNEKLFMTLSVHDIVWGYHEPLITKAVTLLETFLGHKLNISDIFGLFAGTNGTDDGLYSIKTGQDDSNLFGIIKTWNNLSSLTYWNSDTCNMINGTDGTIFHPFIKTSDVLYVYSTDLCRSIYFTYERPNKQKGVDVYRFTTPPDVFMNVKDNPANEGFCTPRNNCLESGLLNMENCHYGAPLIFSQPHFLNADPMIQNAVFGMFPNVEEHGTFIDIEPNTGAAFYAAKRLQLNIKLQQVAHVKQTANVRSLVLPVMWLNESAVITPELVDKFKAALQTPLLIIHIVIWLAIAVGSAIFLLAVMVMVRKKIKSQRASNLENSDMDYTRDTRHLVGD